MAKFRKKPVVEEITAKQFDPKAPRSEWPFAQMALKASELEDGITAARAALEQEGSEG